MANVAADEPKREQCACGATVIPARRQSNGERVTLERFEARIGSWGIALTLTDELPVACHLGRGTHFKLHRCKLLEVRA